jgi:hypothetical protein
MENMRNLFFKKFWGNTLIGIERIRILNSAKEDLRKM